MKVGDKVMVPRTGGGETPGKIIEVTGPFARVKFICGDTFRGLPSPEGYSDKVGYKWVLLTDLKLVEEA